MKIKATLMAALVVFASGPVAVSAQPYQGGGVRPDPYGYYSQYDSNGYYDRDGRYHQLNAPPPPPAYAPGPPAYAPGPPPPQGAGFYEQGRYERDCRGGGNTAAGTIFGAIAGGALGSAASRGNGGAVVGGAVLGGLLGNTIARDIDCDDQPAAFQVYATGLNGEVGRRYEWRHGNAYGYFTPTREFQRRGEVCREFTEVSYRGREARSRNGIACRARDGHWRFD